MSSPEASTIVRRFWESVWSQGNAAELTELFHPEMRENGERVDVAQFQRAVISWRDIFPDFTVTIEELLPIGEDRLVSRVTYRGTQRAPWAGLPTSGKSFEGIGIDIFTIDAGRVIELWHSADHYDMAVQLGGRLTPG